MACLAIIYIRICQNIRKTRSFGLDTLTTPASGQPKYPPRYAGAPPQRQDLLACAVSEQQGRSVHPWVVFEALQRVGRQRARSPHRPLQRLPHGFQGIHQKQDHTKRFLVRGKREQSRLGSQPWRVHSSQAARLSERTYGRKRKWKFGTRRASSFPPTCRGEQTIPPWRTLSEAELHHQGMSHQQRTQEHSHTTTWRHEGLGNVGLHPRLTLIIYSFLVNCHYINWWM